MKYNKKTIKLLIGIIIAFFSLLILLYTVGQLFDEKGKAIITFIWTLLIIYYEKDYFKNN